MTRRISEPEAWPEGEALRHAVSASVNRGLLISDEIRARLRDGEDPLGERIQALKHHANVADDAAQKLFLMRAAETDLPMNG